MRNDDPDIPGCQHLQRVADALDDADERERLEDELRRYERAWTLLNGGLSYIEDTDELLGIESQCQLLVLQALDSLERQIDDCKRALSLL